MIATAISTQSTTHTHRFGRRPDRINSTVENVPTKDGQTTSFSLVQCHEHGCMALQTGPHADDISDVAADELRTTLAAQGFELIIRRWHP